MGNEVCAVYNKCGGSSKLFGFHVTHTQSSSMETLLFLFPQFNYMAPKEEAYFKTLGPQHLLPARMKDETSRLVSGWYCLRCLWCCRVYFIFIWNQVKL